MEIRPSRSFVALGLLLSLVVWWVLSETIGTIIINWLIDRLASLAGIERAKMIAAVSTYIVLLAVAGVAIYGAYLIGVQDREKNKPSGLKILYDHVGKGHVGVDKQGNAERYWVWLKNASTEKTLYDVTLRAKAGKFVHETIAIAHQRPGKLLQSEPVLLERQELHPEVVEKVMLFGISLDECADEGARDFFSRIHKFTLEARARDTKTVTADFEFNPQATPMLRRIS